MTTVVLPARRWRSSAAGILPAHLWRRCRSFGRRRWPYCIVAFHRVSIGSDSGLSFPPDAFAALCQYWRDHYEIISLDTLLVRLSRRCAGTQPSLVITFDDGYADNAETAAPILCRLELSAAFFITSHYIGTMRRFPWDAGVSTPPRLMSWDQVRELHSAGFLIGSHTANHSQLAGLDDRALMVELVSSRFRIEQELGSSVLDFAYPYGGHEDISETARQAVIHAGYRSCFSCHGGLVQNCDPAWRLNRIAIDPRYHATPAAWERCYWHQLRRAEEHRARHHW